MTSAIRPDPTPQQVLSVPTGSRWAARGVTTVGGYFAATLARPWERGEGFSGKRPLGEDAWRWDVYEALGRAGYITTTYDADGYTADADVAAGDRLIHGAIEALGKAATP